MLVKFLRQSRFWLNAMFGKLVFLCVYYINWKVGWSRALYLTLKLNFFALNRFPQKSFGYVKQRLFGFEIQIFRRISFNATYLDQEYLEVLRHNGKWLPFVGHFVTVNGRGSIIYNVIVVASNDNESSQVTLSRFSVCVPVEAEHCI